MIESTLGARARRGRKAAAGAACALAAMVLTYAGSANAAGLYFSDRGVRPLGRGGAYIAGADDVGAIWYNPAGLSDAGTSLMADFSWLNFSSDYTRQTAVKDTAGTVHLSTYQKVSGTTPFLPIPTLGGSYKFNDQFTGALGLYAPYTAIASYPLTINDNGVTKPSPSRYSLVSMDGSALVVIGAYGAYKPIEQLRLGLGLQALVGSFDSTVVFSASPPDRVLSAPEDPNYDSFSRLRVGPIFSPSANMGITAVPIKQLRIGTSLQLPFSINAPAKVDVKLPNAAEFDNAVQNGNDATVKFELPAIFRAGIEGRFDIGKGAMRAEIAFVREFWTTHHSIDITPKNITLVGITGLPSPFGVSPISVPRNFDNANSYRIGAEYALPVSSYVVTFRGGLMREDSAIPANYLSPLTIDMSKWIMSFGGGLTIGKHWRLDAVLAFVIADTVNVDPTTAAVPRVNPVQGNPTATEAVNGGKYEARATVLGVGLNYSF